MRLSLADVIQQNSNVLGQRWGREETEIVGNSPQTIIDMPFEYENTISNGNADTINSNHFPSLFHRHIKNIALVITRNLVSVGGPTVAREYVRHAVLPALFENIPQAARVSTGGIARDIHAGTQTPESLSARLANIALVAGSGAALAATGGLPAAANALIAAVFVYVPLRDLSQYFLQLEDNNGGNIHFGATALSAAAYTGNQFAVDQGMEMLTNRLEPVMGTLAANMLGRAIINIGGETLDELTNRGLHTYSSGNPGLELNLGLRSRDDRTHETALNQIFNTLAGRASLFSAAYSGAFAAPVQGLINSMVVGATLGAGYIPFVYGHTQRAAEESHNLEGVTVTNFRTISDT